MSKSETNKATKPTNDNAVAFPAPTKAPEGKLIGLDGPSLKAASVLASTIVFSSPVYALQANPTNILAMADLFEKYCYGEVKVSTPEAEPAETIAG